MARTPAAPQTVKITAGQSLEAATASHPAGTAYQLEAGIWREVEAVFAKSGDQYVGDPGGGTVFSGARILDQWTRQGSLWRHPGLPDPLTDSDPVFEGSQANNRNDLFIDDQLQQRVGSRNEVAQGTWWFDPADNAVVMATDPNGHLVEYSVANAMTWDTGATGVLWQDIVVEKYATEAQNGAHHGCRQWTYTNCTFRHMHGAGINIGADTQILGGKYIDNGQCGISGYACPNAKVENAELARNGFIGYNTDWDGGGLKICAADNVVLRGNHVHHNKDQGLWGDIDCTNWLIEGNTSEDNTGVGIMYEISYGETRIVSNTLRRNGGIGGYGAGGIYVSNSMGVDVSNNTVEVKPGNTAIGGGIAVLNQDRGSGNQGTYEARNVNVHHNTITHSDDTAQDGFWLYQPINNPAISFDSNAYIVKDVGARHWRYVDADLTWDELRATGQEANGTLNAGDGGGQPPDPEPIPPDPDEIPTLAPGTYKVTQGTTLIV